MSLSVKVGSFTKPTGTGVPVSQAVTGLGFQPKAIIFFSEGLTTSNTWSSGINEFIGFTAGSANSGAVAQLLQDAGSFCAIRQAAVPVTFSAINGTVVAEASLTSFDSDGFTLSWTTNTTSAWIVHYIALGGTDLTNANVVSWTASSSLSTSQSVTGVGFKPDCVIHLGSTASNGSAPYGCLGVADASGNQWVVEHGGSDVGGTCHGACALDPAACAGNYNAFNSTQLALLNHVSMDTDGFTVLPCTSSGLPMYTLCLKGAQFKAGVFGKIPVSTTTQPIPETQFTPALVLLATHSKTSYGPATGRRFAFGASDGTNHHGMTSTYRDGVSTSVAKSLDSVTRCVTKADNDTATTEAAATVSAMGASGFTMSWATNDTPRTLMAYLAIGPAAAAASGGGTRAYGFAG